MRGSQLLLVMVLVVLVMVGTAKSKNKKLFKCKCGEARPGIAKSPRRRVKRSLNNSTLGVEDEMTDRITEGYDPYARPWMVNIEYFPGGKSVKRCAGSLLNKRWVLTAAHCFCPEDNTLQCDQGKPPKPKYNLKKNVKLLIGFSILKDINGNLRKKYRKNNLRSVGELYIHKKYTLKNLHHDLALIKLNKPVKLSKKIYGMSKRSQIMPICITDSKKPRKPAASLFVAGWGALNGQECKTTRDSPDPLKMCMKQFKYKELIRSDDKRCINDMPPVLDEHYNKWCQELNNQEGRSLRGRREADVTHVLQKGRIVAKCYNKRRNRWCATCQRNAKPGEPGYCPMDQASAPSRTRAQKAIEETLPEKGHQRWGYCDYSCFSSGKDATSEHLQEAKLKIIDDESKCQNKKRKVLKGAEFCAAAPFKLKIQEYEGTNNTIYSFKRGRFRQQLMGTGFTDSCQGDSGGPLWVWLNRKNKGHKKRANAFLIGVVSRGYGCAVHDYPGIYTLVNRYLWWIKKIIKKDGDC